MAAWRDQRQPAAAIYEENREAVQIFLAADTQWRVGGLNGSPVGLDFAAVREIAEQWLGIQSTPAIFDKLRVMEAEALRLIRESRK